MSVTQNAAGLEDETSRGQGGSQHNVASQRVDDYAHQSSSSLPSGHSNGKCVQRALQ